ncbi:hypothetical protein FrEUN1fDRAFT_0772 [Parafrankia sp. EUN1f]|nr:hypothetical protein FrEUN1fDRAFT_0772 [Parafrankia sp. EUN1f]
MGAGRLDDPDLTRRPGDAASAAAADGGSDAPRRSSLPGTGRGESRADDGRPAGGGPSASAAGSAGSGSGGASSPFFQRNGRDSSSSNDRGKAPGAARSEARSGAAAAGEPTKEGGSSAGSGSGSGTSGSASGSGTSPARKPGGTDRATPAPRGSDADRGAGARTTTAKTTIKSTSKTTATATTRDGDPADPAGGDPRKPSMAKTRTGTDTRTPAAAAGPNTARTDGSRSDTTRKHDAQSTVATPAARPTSALDGPRDTDTISLVRPNLPRRGTGSTTDRGGDSMKKTDRAAVTERMPAERRPTPEPVRAGSGAGRPTPADRTAPYDRPGTPPGVQPPPGRLGPGALSTEPLAPPDGPMPSRPGPLGPPGPQAGPRGPQSPQQGGRDHGGYEPLRSDRAEAAERRPPPAAGAHDYACPGSNRCR